MPPFEPEIADLVARPIFPPWWRHIVIDLNCKTRVLLVTDGLTFDPASGFGLSEARDIIAAAATTNHDIEVTAANWNADASADVDNFRFSGTHTVAGDSRTIHDYEEIWVFGIASATSATAMSGADLAELGNGVRSCNVHKSLFL